MSLELPPSYKEVVDPNQSSISRVQNDSNTNTNELLLQALNKIKELEIKLEKKDKSKEKKSKNDKIKDIQKRIKKLEKQLEKQRSYLDSQSIFSSGDEYIHEIRIINKAIDELKKKLYKLGGSVEDRYDFYFK